MNDIDIILSSEKARKKHVITSEKIKNFRKRFKNTYKV